MVAHKTHGGTQIKAWRNGRDDRCAVRGYHPSVLELSSVHDSNGMQQTFILREAAEIEMHGTVANNTDAS
jgi:hypothetical protein